MKKIPVGLRDFALVDDEDFDKVSILTWTLIEWRGKKYAKHKVYPSGEMISMHSLILSGVPEVDHIDGDGLNNQRFNLRAVTHAQNIQNQKVQTRSLSGYRGVTLFQPETRNKPWRARIKVDGRDRTIGYFSTRHEAAKAWNVEALKAWGPYAKLNQISEERR